MSHTRVDPFGERFGDPSGQNSYSTATGVLELTLHPHAPLTARFIPAVVSSTGQPIPDSSAAARQAAAHYASLATCAELASKPS